MIPILTVFCVWVGILGGEIVATTYLRTPEGLFWNNLYENLQFGDFVRCVLKAFVFGGLIATVGCHAGLRAEGGAEGVGRATTNTVVQAVVAVIIADLLFTAVFYKIGLG